MVWLDHLHIIADVDHRLRKNNFTAPCTSTAGDGEIRWLPPSLSSLPPTGSKVVQLRILAKPPVAAGAGIIVFSRTSPANPNDPNDQPPFSRVGNQAISIDNLPKTPEGDTFQLPVRSGMDYVIRFQGEAHLLLPGFESVEVGLELSHAKDLLEDFGGRKTANNTRFAAINGQTFFRHA
jgi:hypothetical protein